MKTLIHKLSLSLLASLIILVLIIGGFWYDISYGFPLILKPKTRSFVKKWQSEFNKHTTIEQFQSDSSIQPGTTNQIYLRQFENGDWLIAKAIDSHDWSGVDATVFRDSHGKTYYQTWHHFCGFVMLTYELDKIKADNLDQFYARIKEERIRLKKLR